MDSVIVGARFPIAIRDYLQSKTSTSKILQSLIFDFIEKEDGIEKLEEICTGFKAYSEWKFSKRK